MRSKCSRFHFVSILIFFVTVSTGLKRKHFPSQSSWRYLDAFTFIPVESSQSYYGFSGRAVFHVRHNSESHASLWLLGVSSASKSILRSQGASSLSCQQRVLGADFARLLTHESDIASPGLNITRKPSPLAFPHIADLTNTFQSNLTAELRLSSRSNVDTFKYVSVVEIDITSINLHSSRPASVAWAIASCAIECRAYRYSTAITCSSRLRK